MDKAQVVEAILNDDGTLRSLVVEQEDHSRKTLSIPQAAHKLMAYDAAHAGIDGYATIDGWAWEDADHNGGLLLTHSAGFWTAQADIRADLTLSVAFPAGGASTEASVQMKLESEPENIVAACAQAPDHPGNALTGAISVSLLMAEGDQFRCRTNGNGVDANIYCVLAGLVAKR